MGKDRHLSFDYIRIRQIRESRNLGLLLLQYIGGDEYADGDPLDSQPSGQ